MVKLWEIWAFKEKGPSSIPNYKGKLDYAMLDMVSVVVYAENEKEALKKAKSRVQRKHYRLGKMWEYAPLPHEPGLGEEMTMTQLKMQKEMLDLMKREK